MTGCTMLFLMPVLSLRPAGVSVTSMGLPSDAILLLGKELRPWQRNGKAELTL